MLQFYFWVVEICEKVQTCYESVSWIHELNRFLSDILYKLTIS